MKLRSPEPQRLLLDTLDTLLARENPRVLDVGAGNVVEKNRRAGQPNLADKYAQLVARPGYLALDVEPGDAVNLVADAHALPIADNSLDAVLMVSVLEHLYNPLAAVEDVYRALKPGGIYFSYAPFYHPYHASPHDYFRFTREGYGYLLRMFSRVELASGGNYVAAANDVLSHAFGGSRPGRLLARLFVEFPARLFFALFDARLDSDIAVGFAACAYK